jgi:hypothetical protein
MRHISEVLRLAAQGHSQREISSSVGISRTSVRNYLARAKQAGLKWPLPEHVDEAVIEARLFKRTDDLLGHLRGEAWWEGESKGLSCPEVDYELELTGLLDGQLARLRPAQHFVDEVRGAPPLEVRGSPKGEGVR